MKRFISSLLLAAGLAFSLHAADGHSHDGAKAGPTGGRLIARVEPHAEFLVNADRKIEIRFVDDHQQVVAPGEQVVTVIMGDRAAPTRLAFSREGDKLISDRAIPEGNNLPTIVQIKGGPSAKAVTERFNLNLSQCPACKNAEYACACSDEDRHDHDHDHSGEKK
ncbi:MAG TPA: hypothetical protein VNQ90_15180 [Chthoniobacteraceae bacterium]|nr:hypothetical protein [Chthoniobacteraceae bacterium]